MLFNKYFNWVFLRNYPRTSSKAITERLNRDNGRIVSTVNNKRKEIQARVRKRMAMESLLLEEYEHDGQNQSTETDIGALIKKADELKLGYKTKDVYSSPGQLRDLPWTIESVMFFFKSSFPLILDDIQVIDLRNKLSAPVQWLIVIPISNQRLRITVGEEFIISFKKHNSLSQLHLHGDLKFSSWVLLELGSIYVNLMTPEEMERVDLVGLWTDSELLSLPNMESSTSFVKSTRNEDPNYIPTKILKIAKKLEYEKKRQSFSLLSRKEKKRIKHFGSSPIISLSPSSMFINSSLTTQKTKDHKIKIDKRFVLEGDFEVIHESSRSTTEEFSTVAQNIVEGIFETTQDTRNELNHEEFDVDNNLSAENDVDFNPSQIAKIQQVSRLARRRTQQARMYRKVLEKHSKELRSMLSDK